jgi:hypothetical protein
MIKAPVSPAGSPPFAVAIQRDLVAWITNLIRLPQPRKVYTLATLPDATDFDGETLPVSDGASNRPSVTSVNGAWRYQDGTAV